MKNVYWVLTIMLVFIFAFIFGIIMQDKIQGDLMEGHTLYNCLYNNADSNKFNPNLIEKIEDECICFRKYDYTNLLEANC